MTPVRLVWSIALASALSFQVFSSVLVEAESLAGTDGNPPTGCATYAIAGNAWAATGCPDGTRRSQNGRTPPDTPAGDGELLVEVECTTNPEFTIVENIGDTDVLIETLTSIYNEQTVQVDQVIEPGELIEFETGRAATGPDALSRNHLYDNDFLDEEGALLETDAGEFLGDCVDA